MRCHDPFEPLPAPSDAAAFAATPERAALPDELRWDLGDLYPDDAAWAADLAALVARLPEAEAPRGTLGRSAAELADALDALFALYRKLGRLQSYAGLRADEDTRDSAGLALRLKAQQAATELAARAAWVEPEIVALDPEVVAAYVAAEPRLAPYRHFLDDLQRRRAHTGTAGEERILAEASRTADGPHAVHGLLVDAEMPRPAVVLASGETVALDAAAFAKWRASAVRDDRRKVFDAWFGRLGEFRRTFGATLNAQVQHAVFAARARRYGSTLEHALDADALPTAVYRRLLADVGAHLPQFHRYLALRRRILGVERLAYHDLYAPLVAQVDRRYPWPEAARLAADSCAPLGGDYRDVVRRAFAERWIDALPAAGKRSGAYSNGHAYDVHPYVLMNYQERYDDVSTLAHELGHAMQSFLSNRDQPFPTARYPIFVAEVASTFHEALLLHHVLARTDDDAERLALLGNWLESVKGTLFRQTQFAEFELAIHERVEGGHALTGDSLDELYLAIARRYYGHDAGVCEVADVVRSEWAYIPHFYYGFYVYQYATAFTASTALSERVLGGDAEATRRYLAFLSAGGSDYPLALLRRAGVDLAAGDAFALTMRRMARVMDEVEALVERVATK
jgi:oligoendopeptidase F